MPQAKLKPTGQTFAWGLATPGIKLAFGEKELAGDALLCDLLGETCLSHVGFRAGNSLHDDPKGYSPICQLVLKSG